MNLYTKMNNEMCEFKNTKYPQDIVDLQVT